MRKFIEVFLLVAIVGAVYFYKEPILAFLVRRVFPNEEVIFEQKNPYYLNYQFQYVKDRKDFELKNKKDLLDLYFTIINSGVDQFSFYCPLDYGNCIQDIIDIANNQTDLSNINGFVHPFNSFDTIESTYNSLGIVKLKIIKTYTDVEIEKLNQKVEEIIASEVKDEKDVKTIIRILHDYIINHTKYDKNRTDHNIIQYASNTAYGVLFEGYGICSGYADAMALFLNYYHIPNYKVASENHVWNAVYLDGEWLHLDLTWDDPIINGEENVLDHSYFLITTEKLQTLDSLQHSFNQEIFRELAS